MATISLKLLIDKSTKKVILAEAGKDFVDFLFGLLEIPLGFLLWILANEGMCQSWSLSKVYQSVANLGNEYLQTDQTKRTLLNPNLPESNTKGVPLLQQLGYGKSHASTSSSCFGTTPGSFGTTTGSFGTIPDLFESAFGPGFGSFGLSPGSFGASPGLFGFPRNDNRKEVDGYVKGSVTYMISDDLTVKPMSSISSISLINSFGVKDKGTLEEKIVNVDKKKALQLVKTCFESNTVLTDVFVGKTVKKCETDE